MNQSKQLYSLGWKTQKKQYWKIWTYRVLAPHPSIIPNIGWSQTPFLGKPIPENIYGPYLLIIIFAPFEYVKKYLPDEHLEDTSLYTNMYAIKKLGKELKTTANKIKIVYGVHTMICVFNYPQLRIYWNSKGMLFDPIGRVITRNKFLTIRSCLHYVEINNRSPNLPVS